MASEVKVSFLSKEKHTCPVCETRFHREDLLSGSGRLIAGALTDELHRLYDPSVKYGEVFPLVYQATVCPECWFASMDRDFAALPKMLKNQILDDRKSRVTETQLVFPALDFYKPRNLINGAAALYLAARCYDYYPSEFSPTIKQGIAILRSAWLVDEMNKKYPGQHFDWLAVLFKKKAQYFYFDALKREQSGKEALSAAKNFGPDTDKNYAYEGVLYMRGILEFKYGPRENPELRKEALDEVKRAIAKMFGLGKSSKNKPGPLLELARNLYENINEELHETDE
ncbi:membrane protein [Spirochaetia bacterium]|nr:membrane protein [Spirochaetia bacterium]